MRPVEPDAEDAVFERALLESARDDGPPAGATAAAWSKFVTVSGGVAGSVGVNAAHPRRADGSAWARSAPAAPLKWLVLGALGGSVLTAAWLHQRAGRRGADFTGTVSTPAASVQPTRVATPAPSTPRSELVAASRVAAGESTPPLAAPTQRHSKPAREDSPRVTALPAKPAGVSARPVAEAVDVTTKASSRLAAEVAALDAVRTALAIGAPAQALHGIETYRREFPEGALTPDAHALEVEALVEQGDRAGARRASERFLTRYPKDPHVTRVRSLTEQ